MKSSRSFSIFVFTFLVLAAGSSPNAQSIQSIVKVTGGITTLYAFDPIAQSLCLRDGEYGSVIQENEVRNRCSDLNFNSYNANGFTVGVEGGREGVIIDLGTPSELQKKYAYGETVGNGQGFASITVKDGKAYILQDRRTRAMQEIKGVESLFQKPLTKSGTAQVKVGHIYIMRLTDTHDKHFDRLAKLIVIAHVPGESVTFRWLVL